MANKLTTEIFIERARQVHGDRYDYSKVEYVDSATKVCIICKEHGEFWQNPRSHMNGYGCLLCGQSKTRESKVVGLGASKQRNPLMADLAARTMIFRGLGSGIVRALRENVVIDFVNEDEANQFRVIIWRTNDAEQIKQFLSDLYADKYIQKEEGGMDDSIQKKDKYIQKTMQMDIEGIQKGIQRVLEDRHQKITEIQMSVLLYFAKHPVATRKDYVKDTEGATEGGTISAIGRLQELRLLNRQGGKKNGYWEVIFE